MKGILTTFKGMEDIAALEVRELIFKKAEIRERCVDFDIGSYEDLFRLCYMSQSASGVYLLLSEFGCKNLFEDLDAALKKIDLNEWLAKKSTFRVRCRKEDSEETPTPEIESRAGEIIIGHIYKKHGYKQKVSLDNPNITFFLYLASAKCYFCIDFAGFDLSKRPYKIFSDPASIKCPLAYCMIRLSGYTKKESLLDCFSASGIIPIEAALFALDFPVNFYNKERFAFMKMDKFANHPFKSLFKKFDSKIGKTGLAVYSADSQMKYVQFAKKNSRIAGIDKKITFSRMDIEWLDTKFKKGSIDRIASKLPESQKIDLNKTYREFFYQAEFILAKNGKIAVIGNKELIQKYSSQYSFSIVDGRELFSGDRKYDVFVIVKSLSHNVRN